MLSLCLYRHPALGSTIEMSNKNQCLDIGGNKNKEY